MSVSSPRSRRSKTPGFPVMVRAQPPFVDRIDKWIFANGELMSRAEAIRRLAEAGLSCSRKTGPSGAP